MLILEYLKKGFSVIPVRGAYGKNSADAKKPLIPWAEFQKRKPTESEVLKWIELYPQSGVGIVTGSISGIIVLDLDSEDAINWARANGLLETVTVKTPKGIHAYFRHPGGVIPNTVNLNGIKADIRGDGGYVIAPPTTVAGHTYYWIKDYTQEIAEFPQILTPKNNPRNYKKELKDLYTGVREGERNVSLTRIAGSLVADGLQYEECLRILFSVNEKNRPPLGKNEVENILKSVSRYQNDKKRENITIDDSIFQYPIFVLSKNRIHKSGEININIKTAKVEKQWVVSSNSIFGLGGPFDETVWTAILFYVTGLPKPIRNPIPIKAVADIAKLMDIYPSGKNITAIKQSIERISATSIMCQNVFHKQQSHYYNKKRFSLIQKVIFRGEISEETETEKTNYVYLDEAIIAGINSGYTLPVDWEVYKGLKSPIAKKLYKFLYHLGRKNNFAPLLLTAKTLFDRIQIDHQTDRKKIIDTLREPHKELISRKIISNVTHEGYTVKYRF